MKLIFVDNTSIVVIKNNQSLHIAIDKTNLASD